MIYLKINSKLKKFQGFLSSTILSIIGINPWAIKNIPFSKRATSIKLCFCFFNKERDVFCDDVVIQRIFAELSSWKLSTSPGQDWSAHFVVLLNLSSCQAAKFLKLFFATESFTFSEASQRSCFPIQTIFYTIKGCSFFPFAILVICVRP